MWNLLKNCDEECSKLQDLLEDSSAARRQAASVEELSEAWSPEQRDHIAACERCHEAAEDVFASREIFKGVAAYSEIERPWFATRVMAAIAARERELTETASTWLVVPKFASRLSMASAALLLVATAWLYEKPLPALSQQASTLAAQESLFEAPPSANQDDLLVPVQENYR